MRLRGVRQFGLGELSHGETWSDKAVEAGQGLEVEAWLVREQIKILGGSNDIRMERCWAASI